MERTLVILKPSAIARELVGAIVDRFQRRGLIIQGLKMIQLDDTLLREHYAHLVDRPFFQSIAQSMKATPVIVMALAGLDAVNVVRAMTGATNGRSAATGTIRGDYCVSNQENIVHASDSVENAKIEIKRFFSNNELFDYQPANFSRIYADDEV